MPYIDVISPDEAEGELFAIYDDIQKRRGRVANVLQIHSLHPKGMVRHLDLYMELLYGKGPLSRFQRELIGVVVSRANSCDYCVIHHGEALAGYAKDDALVKAVQTDYTTAALQPADRALADYAVGLTLQPGTGRKAAVAALREAGFDDASILHGNEIAAYFNYVNRMIHGLGIELEGDTDRDYDY